MPAQSGFTDARRLRSLLLYYLMSDININFNAYILLSLYIGKSYFVSASSQQRPFDSSCSTSIVLVFLCVSPLAIALRALRRDGTRQTSKVDIRAQILGCLINICFHLIHALLASTRTCVYVSISSIFGFLHSILFISSVLLLFVVTKSRSLMHLAHVYIYL